MKFMILFHTEDNFTSLVSFKLGVHLKYSLFVREILSNSYLPMFMPMTMLMLVLVPMFMLKEENVTVQTLYQYSNSNFDP